MKRQTILFRHSEAKRRIHEETNRHLRTCSEDPIRIDSRVKPENDKKRNIKRKEEEKMKKLLFAFSLILCFATSAKADDTATSSLSDSEWCSKGVVVRGAHPTKRYCRSTFAMNWYTALSWCQAQGMHLATMSEVCDKSENSEDRWDGSWLDMKCPNFANGESSFNSWVWTGTANPTSSTIARLVAVGTGTISNNSGNFARNQLFYALCY